VFRYHSITPADYESLKAANPPAGFGNVPVITSYARHSPLWYVTPTQMVSLYVLQKPVQPSRVPVSGSVSRSANSYSTLMPYLQLLLSFAKNFPLFVMTIPLSNVLHNSPYTTPSESTQRCFSCDGQIESVQGGKGEAVGNVGACHIVVGVVTV
jgi:hypothetical protein